MVEIKIFFNGSFNLRKVLQSKKLYGSNSKKNMVSFIQKFFYYVRKSFTWSGNCFGKSEERKLILMPGSLNKKNMWYICFIRLKLLIERKKKEDTDPDDPEKINKIFLIF